MFSAHSVSAVCQPICSCESGMSVSVTPVNQGNALTTGLRSKLVKPEEAKKVREPAVSASVGLS